MMMWTKSAINSDTEQGTVHTLRSPHSTTIRNDAPSTETAPVGNPVAISINEGSAEAIAYKLFLHIVEIEDVSLSANEGHVPANRPYILSTYAECIRAVRDGKVD